MSTGVREPQNAPSLLLAFGWSIAAAISAEQKLGFVVYFAVLGWSALNALRRPVGGLWLLLLTFTVAVISVPPDYPDELGGGTPKAYFYWGFSILCVAGAMFIGSLLKRRRFADERPMGLGVWPLIVFLGVVSLAAAYGYLQGNGAGTIVRQGSGLLFLFFFIYLGYRLRPSLAELSESLRNVEVVLIAYAGLYLVRVIYTNLALRFALPDGDFFRERNPILFFCGLFASLEFGRWLFGTGSRGRGDWFGVSLLFASAVLSGSRSIVASMLLTMLFFLLLRHSARPLRICVVVLLLLFLAPYGFQGLVSQFGKESPIIQHIAERYLVSPGEDSSFLQRSSQMSAIWDGLKLSPMLGNGVGASLVWFDPASLKYVETAFVDTGVGYVLLKMGLLGACTFVVLLLSWFRLSWRCWKSLHHEVFLLILGILAYYSAFLPFGPSFFQFLYSFWVGMLIGSLYLLQRRGREMPGRQGR